MLNHILGSSTWVSGDLQDEWYDAIGILKSSDLSGKTVAVFGCGDSYSFSTTFCEADGVFFGKIEDIDGLVNFEGESVAELTNAFHEAVDDYLAYCTEEGIEPHKSYSGSLNVRLTPDIHTRVAYLAKQAGVSINSFIRTAVEKQIAAML